MKPVLYISTILLTAGLFIACNNSVSMGDKEAETEKTQTPLPGDVDGDGILDENDNCPTLANADQADGDGDGVGNVCEDLECASNFCQDNAFLSDRHCDGDVSVGCLAQSDGCLIETSRVSCSEGCGSEGDFMGVCKPKPRDLTDPLITEATGTMSHGSTVTITGEDFGSHDLNIEWTGKRIENDPIGSSPENWTSWSFVQDQGIAKESVVITDQKAWSGSKSIDGSKDSADDDCSICAVRLTHALSTDDWDKIFVSYYLRVESDFDSQGNDQIIGKTFWINDTQPESGTPYNTHRNAWSFGASIRYSNGLSNGFRGGPMAYYYCGGYLDTLPGIDGLLALPSVYPWIESYGVGYSLPGAVNGKYITRDLNTGWSDPAWGPTADSWFREEYYFDRTDVPDTYNGEEYVAIFRPEGGGGAQFGYDPGLYIGRWVKDIANWSALPASQCGGRSPSNANAVGFYYWPAVTQDAGSVRIYFDDIYIQEGTRSRVVLGNNADYKSCTKTEIQFPTAWNDSTIAFELNYGGSFRAGETAYVFVINENEYDDGNKKWDQSGSYDFAGISPGFPIILE